MKRLYAAVTLTVFILAVSAWDSLTVCGCADSLRDGILAVEERVNAGDYEGALALAEKFTENFSRTEKIFRVAVHDEKISELSLSAAKIVPFIEKQSDELEAEIESIYKQIEKIKRAEIPYWYNII